MSIRNRLARSAPARFWRCLVHPPGGTYRERYEQMSEEQKAQERWRSLKRNGLFLTFVDTKPPWKKRGDGERNAPR